MLRPGTMMVSRAGEQLARKQCGCCGEELNAHQAVSSGVCDKLRCQDWKIEQAGTELLQRQREELRNRLFHEAGAAIEDIATRLEADPEQTLRIVLPWQAKPIAPQDPRRRAAFQDHLRQIVDEAFCKPPSDAEDAGRARSESAEAPVLSTACAICAGQCCDRGGTTAMLTAVDIARWRGREPEATSEQAIGAYASHLPAESIAGSCVYLGRDGCALPRPMRADWCNRFQCRQRAVLADRVDSEDTPSVLMVAYDRDRRRSAALGGWSRAAGSVVAAPAADEVGKEEGGPGNP